MAGTVFELNRNCYFSIGKKYLHSNYAGVAQLVECQLPKLKVAGSNPVSRSILLVINSGSSFTIQASQIHRIIYSLNCFS
jgi:hypothetical protein